MKRELSINGESVEVTVARSDGAGVTLQMEGKTYQFTLSSGGHWQTEKGENLPLFYSAGHVVIGGRDIYVERVRPKGAGTSPAGVSSAPMPGKILKVLVREGDEVAEGDPLVVLEAMKMEHTLRAAREGTVRAVHVAEGDRIEAGAEPVELA